LLSDSIYKKAEPQRWNWGLQIICYWRNGKFWFLACWGQFPS
jgi:hypothetical protein